MNLSRRTLVGAACAVPAFHALPRWAHAQTRFTPEQFGAVGNGRTNDSEAFRLLGEAVSRAGGGTIELSRRTYIVGEQARTPHLPGGAAFEPAPLLELIGLRGPLIILGNGAILRCAPGLRYGTFDIRTGRSTGRRAPNFKLGELASPYRWMIKVENCAGSVDISDLELDGNLEALQIGGQWGDTGWQLAASGLALVNNSGPERIRRVHSHHHALDGVTVDGVDRDRPAAARSALEDVRCEYNGRQGLSLVGGRGYSFSRCKFNHTGRSAVASNPGGGVDVEAEQGKRVRGIRFANCEFSNNVGAGMVADSGDSEDVSFTGCTFVGTTNWAVWPNKPRFRFSNCTFVGAIVAAFGDRVPERAALFVDCSFRDDPALAPNGRIYGGENRDRPIADLPSNINVRFARCRFELTHQSVLPWSTDVTYDNCVLSQRSQTISYPRGFYVGRNLVNGRATLSGSRNSGELILNGRPLNKGIIA